MGEQEGLYAAFVARDARFDGQLFVGIKTTGIYCRPVCKARKPMQKNCAFFPTAAQAEQAGFRPCLLCRPELAPSLSPFDREQNLAVRAAQLIRKSCGQGLNLSQTARQLGISDRHFRRLFMEEFQVTPVQYAQTCRLLLAKNLLTDSDLSVLQVAMAAGFGSLRRFNEAFLLRYHLSPTKLRSQVSKGRKEEQGIRLKMGYRPPYLWDRMLGFFSDRAIKGIELVKEGAYLRTVLMHDREGKTLHGWLKVEQDEGRDALVLTISETLLPVLPEVQFLVKRMFDTDCDPQAITAVLAPLNDRKPGLYQEGTRLPGAFEPFEMSVRAILGQQISVKAARTLMNRVTQAFGKPVDSQAEGLSLAFPSPAELLALPGDLSDHLGPLGVTRARAQTIAALAQAMADGKMDWEVTRHPEKQVESLQSIKGIGPWTAHYIAMRTLSWPDAQLASDAGVKAALGEKDQKAVARLLKPFAPYRSYAAINLWNA